MSSTRGRLNTLLLCLSRRRSNIRGGESEEEAVLRERGVSPKRGGVLTVTRGGAENTDQSEACRNPPIGEGEESRKLSK